MNWTFPIVVRVQSFPVIIAFILCLAVPQTINAQTELQYQNRGNRYEGQKPKPVSGYDLELISVVADYQEAISEKTFPNEVTLRFYLNKEQLVYLTVRELDYRTYYWLDRVVPKSPWGVGFGNEFKWSTDPVLSQLTPSIKLYELGALVRLRTETASSIERVAPAVLYSSLPPSRIEGYFFTLKTGEDARLKCSISQENSRKAVFAQTFRRKRAGRPFTIHWKVGAAPTGAYRMEISGFSLSTNQPISTEVQFYHQPSFTP